MVSLGTMFLPLALLIYEFILLTRIFLSSDSGINFLNALELIKPSTCLIDAAVLISTNAAFNALELFVSKSRLIYLPFGNTFGLVDSINTPALFLSVKFMSEAKAPF